MNYFHTCPLCGANLDPGERCNCADNWMKADFLPDAGETHEGKEDRPCRGENLQS